MKIRDVEADPITRLVEVLKKLPGVGPKGAQRMAMHIMRSPANYADELSDRIREVGRQTRFCSVCQNVSTTDPCRICGDARRDKSVICVVEEPADIAVVEKTGVHKGTYHVLHGALSPMDDVGPKDIKVESFLKRVKNERVREVIIATNPDAEGEATAHYLAKRLKSLKLIVTRIARGVPVGGDIQYVDEATLGEAIAGRRKFGPKSKND